MSDTHAMVADFVAARREIYRARFAAAYIEAAVFADWPEDAPDAPLSEELRRSLADDAEAFYDVHSADIDAYESDTGSDAGHDLWFTANGHGVGYWEHRTPEAVRLDAAARLSPARELYVGDDGQVYAC